MLVAQPGINMVRSNKLKSWNSKIEELLFKLQWVRTTTDFQMKSLLWPPWIISINTGIKYLYWCITLTLAGEYTSEVPLLQYKGSMFVPRMSAKRYWSLISFSFDTESACLDFLDWKRHDTVHQPGVQATFQEEINLEPKSSPCISSEAGNYYLEAPWYNSTLSI